MPEKLELDADALVEKINEDVDGFLAANEGKEVTLRGLLTTCSEEEGGYLYLISATRSSNDYDLMLKLSNIEVAETE